MIKIYCDDESQMMCLQAVIAESERCPFDNTNIRCESDFNCYLCVRDNIDWNIKKENKNDRYSTKYSQMD